MKRRSNLHKIAALAQGSLAKAYLKDLNNEEEAMSQGYVYILTNKYNKVLYTGATSDLIKRVFEHKNKFVNGFSSRYNVNKLVYYEALEDVFQAYTRDKQIKGGSRMDKIKLIEKLNPKWRDLYEDLY